MQGGIQKIHTIEQLQPPPRNMPQSSTPVARIAKDLANLQQSADLSLAAEPRSEADIRHVRTLVIGPAGPYEHGFFEFDFTFPDGYPISAPKAVCITTNRGRTRFNPNIYASGKVCLSTLGTWEGLRPGEKWSCCQSLETVLISIQSLMGTTNPYTNEPGFEHTEATAPCAIAYARKVQHETLRISVISRLEDMLGIADTQDAESRSDLLALRGDDPEGNDDDLQLDVEVEDPGDSPDEASENWKPFDDLIKRRFLWYYDSYLQILNDAKQEQKDGVPFTRAAFESRGNQMLGTYRYSHLQDRLVAILQALRQECDDWIASGLQQSTEDLSMALGMASHFAENKKRLARPVNGRSTVELDLPDEVNPFHWRLTIFGEVMTNLDGGIFEIQIVVPPDFPTTWPRARMLTAIHHRNVSSNGTICYVPDRPESMASHLDAIVAAIDDKQPKYDPRMVVNPTASAQFWSEEERKVYNKQLRRSANDSIMDAPL